MVTRRRLKELHPRATWEQAARRILELHLSAQLTGSGSGVRVLGEAPLRVLFIPQNQINARILLVTKDLAELIDFLNRMLLRLSSPEQPELTPQEAFPGMGWGAVTGAARKLHLRVEALPAGAGWRIEGKEISSAGALFASYHVDNFAYWLLELYPL